MYPIKSTSYDKPRCLSPRRMPTTTLLSRLKRIKNESGDGWEEMYFSDIGYFEEIKC
jgi:hypothetical protein